MIHSSSREFVSLSFIVIWPLKVAVISSGSLRSAQSPHRKRHLRHAGPQFRYAVIYRNDLVTAVRPSDGRSPSDSEGQLREA